MKRADMIAEIKKKYCGKCPVHLNKMRSSELQGLLRGGGARGGESRLQPQNRIIGKFTPQKAPKTNSNQYVKNIGEKKEIIKTRRRVGELASINARMRTPRPPMNIMRDDLKGAIRGATKQGDAVKRPKLSETEKIERKINRIQRRARRYKKKEKEVRGQFKENEAMGGEDINRATTNAEIKAKAERRTATRLLREKYKKEKIERKQAKYKKISDKTKMLEKAIDEAKKNGKTGSGIVMLQRQLDKLKDKLFFMRIG
tara:strand:- start:1230 stop:2000 length:771 start_codon:yes stop_codon:yes gene_type:complete